MYNRLLQDLSNHDTKRDDAQSYASDVWIFYASKSIAIRARNDPDIVNLSFGEPHFGPPPFLYDDLQNNELTLDTFLSSVKRYEDPRGAPELREAISLWYERRYGLNVDPAREIMITHGGVEAINLALLCTTEVGDRVAVTDPSYMLYSRTVEVLGRRVDLLSRPAGDLEYAQMIDDESASDILNKSKAWIINSPENPTVTCSPKKSGAYLAGELHDQGLWIIHDEAYDTMTGDRDHLPVRCIDSLANRSILVNSFSKKFGVPGLRIGWIVADQDVIELACKAHDYLYLGVNIQYEDIALRFLTDDRSPAWLSDTNLSIRRRAMDAQEVLGLPAFAWTRAPRGAMFLFPDVTGLYESLPARYRKQSYAYR